MSPMVLGFVNDASSNVIGLVDTKSETPPPPRLLRLSLTRIAVPAPPGEESVNSKSPTNVWSMPIVIPTSSMIHSLLSLATFKVTNEGPEPSGIGTGVLLVTTTREGSVQIDGMLESEGIAEGSEDGLEDG